MNPLPLCCNTDSQALDHQGSAKNDLRIYFWGACFLFLSLFPPTHTLKPKETGSEKTAQWPWPPGIQGPHVCPKGKCGRSGGPGCAGWVAVAVVGVSTHGSLCGRAGLVQPLCSTGNRPAKSTSSTSDRLMKVWFISIFRSASSVGFLIRHLFTNSWKSWVNMPVVQLGRRLIDVVVQLLKDRHGWLAVHPVTADGASGVT